MNAQKRKNHTLESLLAKRVPLNELTAELFMFAKESGISDNKMIDLCQTTQSAFYEFKRKNDLLGVTISGYENNSKHNRKVKEVSNLIQKEETIVEGVPSLKPVTSPAILEYREQNNLLNNKLDQLEVTLIKKDQEISRLNDQADKLQEHLNKLNILVRSLEAENEQLRSNAAVNTVSLEDNHQLVTAKDIIKQLATLI